MSPVRAVVLGVVLTGCETSFEQTPVERELSSGRTLSPGCVGSAYATIQSAISAAATGDVIEVCPGTYRERLTIVGKTLTLRSRDGAATTTIDGQTWGKTLSISGGSDVIVEGFTFVNGSNGGGTGANVSCLQSDLELRDSVLRAGVAYKGGGLGATDCIGVVEDNTFEDGTATWFGGGAFIKGDLLSFEHNTLVTNDATEKGGGLYVEGDSDVLDNTFEENHAENGGAAFITGSIGDIVGNTVSRNTSTDDGAGIYVDQGAPLVADNTFDANDSDDEGGGLRVKLASPVIRNNTFTANHADYRGGALKVSHDDVTMTGNTYIGNTAWVTGGAVLMYESASLVTDETYLDNEADNGGGMAIIAGWGAITLEDCTFDGNSADNGGHLYIDLPGQTTKLRRVDLVDGDADNGGAVWAVGSDIKFENTLFDGNTASVSGGALYLDTVTGKVLNSVAIWNDAPAGGAVSVVDSPNLEFTNDVFRSNSVGAAFTVVSGGPPRVRYSDFSGNTPSNFSGIGNQIGTNGNISASPSFVNAAGGNFALTANSPLQNVGDPVIFDTNGTRSDIGLFGGPQAY